MVEPETVQTAVSLEVAVTARAELAENAAATVDDEYVTSDRAENEIV
jgi:hypothetical protein